MDVGEGGSPRVVWVPSFSPPGGSLSMSILIGYWRHAPHGGLDGVGWYRVGNVIDDNSSCCSTIVHRRQRMIALLTGCVPNLKLDGVVVEGDIL